MFSFFSQSVNTFFPLLCYGCGDVVGTPGVCGPCWSSMYRIGGESLCTLCGAPCDSMLLSSKKVCITCYRHTPLFHSHQSLWAYSHTIKKIIFSLKYGGQTYIAEWIADQMIPHLIALPHVTSIISVPLHVHKLKKRGFNQAGLIAHALSQKTGIPYAIGVLQRLWHTPSQGGKSWNERYGNVEGAFVCEKIQGTVCLIDDVYTTGATLNACAHALAEAGAVKIHALTVAHLL